MKKLLSVLCAILFLGAFLFPAIDAGNLTSLGSGWYSFAYEDAEWIVLLVNYTKGGETNLKVDIGYTFQPWTSKAVMLSQRGSDNVLGDVQCIMDATAVRAIVVPTIQAKGSVLFHVYPTGSLTGTVLLQAEAKH